VLAYPTLAGRRELRAGASRGRTSAGVEEIAIDLPMTRARSPAQAAYDAGRGADRRASGGGADVVCLCEGDPLFYGSFMYLQARLAGGSRSRWCRA
jgi:precorrin-2/cobalt-factor-2 C20-methyltransferase